MTLAAAGVAWVAVQAQIKEQRRSVESQRRDAANIRFTVHFSNIFKLYNQFAKIETAPNQAIIERLYSSVDELSASEELFGIPLDPLMGKNSEAVTMFISSVRNA